MPKGYYADLCELSVDYRYKKLIIFRQLIDKCSIYACNIWGFSVIYSCSYQSMFNFRWL